MAFNSFSQERDVGESQKMSNQRAARAPTNKQINRLRICPVTTTTKRRNTRGRRRELRAGARPDNKLPYRLQAPPGPPINRDPLPELKMFQLCVLEPLPQRSHRDEREGADKTRNTTLVTLRGAELTT